MLLLYYKQIKKKMDIEEILNDYTRNEVPIYSKKVFDSLLNEFPNDREMNVYRGINFTDKDDYESFLEEFNNNGGYISSACAGFAKTYQTAYDFSTTTKTYFPTLEVMMEESKRREFSEKISGYRGLILKAKVKPGEVIDVNKSNVGIEDEVLFKPDTLILCEIEIVKPFREQVEEKDFNLNDYIKKTTNDEDSLLNYILVNKSEFLTEEVRDILLERAFERFNKQATYKIEKDNDEKILADYDNLVVFSRKNYRFGEATETVVYFLTPNFKTLELYGVLEDKQRNKISKIAENIVLNALDSHIKYRDKYKINYLGIKNLTPYVSEETRELYQRAIAYKKRDNYVSINNALADIINKGNHKGNKQVAIQEELNKLTKLFEDIVGDIPKDMNDINKEKEARIKRRKKL